MFPWLLPSYLSRPFVERHDKLVVDAVARENQEVAVKDRRTGRPLYHVIIEPGVFPENAALRIETHSAARAEVNIHPFAVQHRCR